MKGDFSRFTFDPRKHYTGVRMQQGRVQLDADWNEQVDILLDLIRGQQRDLVGQAATGAAAPGFAITLPEPDDESEDRSLPDFWIGAGRYYVEGILCENETPVLFSRQPDFPGAAAQVGVPAAHDQYLVYLDAWQRHITVVEDPSIREIALGGPDTTTRVKTVWQVKHLHIDGDPDENQRRCQAGELYSLPGWSQHMQQEHEKLCLAARMDPANDRPGQLENRLYRVELHASAGDHPTYKWSRDNGSVVFPFSHIERATATKKDNGCLRVTLESQGIDTYQLREGTWVELADDHTVLNGEPLPLCQVLKLDRNIVTLQAKKERVEQVWEEFCGPALAHPLLRRWEDDAKPVPSDGQGWLLLEKGIQVHFSDTGASRPGDYWMIPARSRSESGIEWPQENGQPQYQPAHGSMHAYAPLALLQFNQGQWVVSPNKTAEFESLPQVKASLSDTNSRLAGLVERLRSFEDQVDGLAQSTHVFEVVRSSKVLGKGDVVSLDRDAIERLSAIDPFVAIPVRHASAKDGKLVLGVVWEANEEESSETTYRVVVHGRARCKVIGRVEPGDLLVPAEEEGHARRARWYERSEMIIGKAVSFTRFAPKVMEQIEEGKRKVGPSLDRQPGTVEVLVALG
jgi:hypothetical protein